MKAIQQTQRSHMKTIAILGLLLACGQVASAQVGVWQLTLSRTDGVDETGLAYFTLNGDGTMSGYSLTTLSYTLTTYSGSWSTADNDTLLITLARTQLGVTLVGTVSAKFSAKKITGTITFPNALTYKFKGIPAVATFNSSVTYSGTLRQGSENILVDFNLSPNFAHPNVYNVAGTVGVIAPFSGQFLVTPTGRFFGYTITDLAGELTTVATLRGRMKPTSLRFTGFGLVAPTSSFEDAKLMGKLRTP
jgi:hypothetical protein